MVIAIDGPSGVGKSTVARGVAAALGIAYLDTGSYYRAATLLALQSGADPGDESEVLEALESTELSVVDGVLRLDGQDVTEQLRGPEVTDAVSLVAAHPGVRRSVVAMQRRWVEAHGGSAVVEGRDIGTVVFPRAAVKVFLTATAATRAARRATDEESQGREAEDLQAEMERRDIADSTRRTSPLKPADDAVAIATDDLSVAEVIAQVLDLAGRP